MLKRQAVIRLGRLGVGLWLAGVGAGALACALCLNAFEVTLRTSDLVHAQRVVLAVPQDDGLRVIEVIKGGIAAGARIGEPVARLAAADLAGGKPLLLIREDRWVQWVSMGAVDAAHAALLRELATPIPVGPRGDALRTARVGSLLASLESAEPMVAEIAYGEIATSSYGSMRANRANIDVAAVRRWVDDPALVSRHDLYWLLLGIAGGPADAAAIERRLDAQRAAKDATNLGSLLAADLELRGPPRLAWLEKHYLRDAGRTQDEQRAAVQSLGVLGSEDATIPRARVIALYQRLVKLRIPAGALAAADLAQWQVWDVVPAYRAWLASGVPLPGTARSAIQDYLDRAPLSRDSATGASAHAARQPRAEPSTSGPAVSVRPAN